MALSEASPEVLLLHHLERLEEQAFNELVRMGNKISELEQDNLKLSAAVEKLNAQLQAQMRHPLLRILRQAERLRSVARKATLLLGMGLHSQLKFTSASGFASMRGGAWFALAGPRELSAPLSLEPGRYKVKVKLSGPPCSPDTLCDLYVAGPRGSSTLVSMSLRRARGVWRTSFVVAERTRSLHIRLTGPPQDLRSTRIALLPVRLRKEDRRAHSPNDGLLGCTIAPEIRALPFPDTTEVYREWLRLYPRDLWAPPEDLSSQACFHVKVSRCAPTLREALGTMYSLASQDVSTIEVTLSPEFLEQVGVGAADQILGSVWCRSPRECEGSHYYLEMLGGDQLSPDALRWYAETKYRNPKAEIIYSDHDFISSDGHLKNPYFKPDWSPTLFARQDYLSRAVAFCEDGRLGSDAEPAGRLNLRTQSKGILSAAASGEIIVHIPRVLHHLAPGVRADRNGALEPSGVKEPTRASGDPLTPLVPVPIRSMHESFSVHTGRVASILIPAAAPTEVVSKCLQSILRNTASGCYEILVDINGPHQEDIQRLVEGFSGQAEIKVVETAFDPAEGFNYSRLVNNLARHSSGDVLILLNDDTEILHASWLDQMVYYATLPGAGAVGVKLVYQDGRVQHGGMVLGLGGICAHSFVGYPGNSRGYQDYLRLPREVSAVTAAAMAVRSEKFWSVGGFDEQNLAVSFNDVDFCLKLLGAGFVNLFVPDTEIMHHESLSRGHPSNASKWLVETREVDYMKRRWATELTQGDRYYNPNLSLDYGLGGFKLSFPPRDWYPACSA